MQIQHSPGILTRIPRQPRKVIVIGQIRLGGFLCTTPALRALKHALPQTEITMLTVGPLRDLVIRSRHLDHFVPVPDLMLEQSQRPIDARGFTQFLREMQEERFDLAVQLRGYGMRSSPYFPLLGAEVNVGFVGPADMPLLDAALPFPKQGHLIDRCLELTTFLGAPPVGRHTEFALDSDDHIAAAALLAGARTPVIGIHPTASETERIWPAERFAAVANELQQRYGGTVVLVTEQRDDPAAAFIASHVSGPCFNLAGRTGLPVLGAVVERFDLFVTNDTGPAHIAYALGTPTVTLFASESPTPFWPPTSGPFRPLTCNPPTFVNAADSLVTITVSQVIQAAAEVIVHGA